MPYIPILPSNRISALDMDVSSFQIITTISGHRALSHSTVQQILQGVSPPKFFRILQWFISTYNRICWIIQGQIPWSKPPNDPPTNWHPPEIRITVFRGAVKPPSTATPSLVQPTRLCRIPLGLQHQSADCLSAQPRFRTIKLGFSAFTMWTPSVQYLLPLNNALSHHELSHSPRVTPQTLFIHGNS
ncbi:hypothetical protein BDN72DRAFT_248984 [Pluteus cervinus]|uniref:Uncharacterized protein n=1 Tax=Pluteus cervinus TaxID=181527 RepID=A0ACD3B6B7_9AGAR|nr:hypothetical protein BDN72DRAFT_248984 [Pluteus cervinus]